MTPSEIKKIVEEYVNYIVNRMGIPKEYVSAETRKGLRYDCEPILQWLTARFYLVEKDKVEEEYEGAKWHKETAEGMNIQYGKGMARGQIMTLENLFGSNIRKEEEE